MRVSLLTGGGDKPYSLGILEELVSKGIEVEFIGNDEMRMAEIAGHRRVKYFNLRGDQNPIASAAIKMARVFRYYFRLIGYASKTKSPIFHILWFNKFQVFDKTLLNIYYKLLGKRIVFTAHNVDEKERDGGNNVINWLTLKILYRLVDHIFVHTEKMKLQLVNKFNLAKNKVTVIPFGINNTIPKSDMTKAEARGRLDLKDNEKVLLFFGNIAPYKGLEILLYALDHLRSEREQYKLIIAGQIKGCQHYWDEIELIIRRHNLDNLIIRKISYIPDEEVESLFKASDVLILPYKFIYQSGVLFLSYSFGLPVIASDVGSLREDILEGKTGMICREGDPQDLAKTISTYFKSDLYQNINENMMDIVHYANEKYSWDKVGTTTIGVYNELLKAKRKKWI